MLLAHSHRRRAIVAVALSCGMLACDLLLGRPGSWAAEPISEAVVRTAIIQLGSESFLEREAGSQRIREVGIEQLPLLEQAAATADELEVTTRILTVFDYFALQSPDEALREAATDCLTRLAVARSGPTALRAAALLTEIAAARRSAAISHLERCGASIRLSQAFAMIGGLPVAAESVLEVGPLWHGTDDDLQQLALLGEINHVLLSGDHVTDDWLRAVSKLSGVRSLVVKRAKITSRGMQALSDLKDLQLLEVLYSPIDDDSLQVLSQMRQLSLLRLFGTKITKAGGAQLSAALLTAKVDLRRGGFLGVGVQKHDLGCIISNVQPRSAAARAGVEIGDVVLSFAGENPKDFEELTNVIAKFQPGDEVTIEVDRDGQREDRKITLGEWE